MAVANIWTPDKVKEIREFAGLTIDDPQEIKQKGRVIIIYGPGGAGKTTTMEQFIGTEYVTRGIVHLDVDAGHESVQTAIEHQDIQHITIRDWNSAKKFQDKYVQDQPWDLVFVDNVSELQVLNMKTIDPQHEVHEIQYYNTSQAQMMSYVRTWRDIASRTGITVVLIGWEMGVTAAATNLTKAMIALPHKLSEKMPGMVGIVIHLTVENDRHKTRCMSIVESSAVGVAKFRRDDSDKAAWSIPDDVYYRRGEKPLVDMLETMEKGVMFPADKYVKNRRGEAANANV